MTVLYGRTKEKMMAVTAAVPSEVPRADQMAPSVNYITREPYHST